MHPSLAQARIDGQMAALWGKPPSDNPFPLNTQKSVHWSRGWDDATEMTTMIWTDSDKARLCELFAEGHDDRALMRLTGRSKCAILMMRNKLRLMRPEFKRHLAIRPDDFATYSHELRTELMARYGVGKDVISRWWREAGVVRKSPAVKKVKTPRGSKTKGGYWCNEIPQLGGAEIDRAKLHLQRVGYRPVVKAEYSGKQAPPGHYLVGAHIMPPEEMIALALSKGFDRDEWKRAA